MAVDGSTGSTSTSKERRRPYPASTHLLFISAVVLPLAALPYLATRGRVRLLQLQVDQANNSIALLKKGLNRSVSQMAVIKNETQSLQTRFEHARQDVETLRHLADAREASAARSMDSINGDMQTLASQSRSCTWALRELGVPLADFASFMDKVERQVASQARAGDEDPCGIERLRRLVQKIQDLPNLPPRQS